MHSCCALQAKSFLALDVCNTSQYPRLRLQFAPVVRKQAGSPGLQSTRSRTAFTRPREQDTVLRRVGAAEQNMEFQQLAKAETISPVESEHAPFVVLMGWVNCDHKYLAKYSELLSKSGYSSLRTIQPTFTGFSVAEAPRRLWASNILNYLLERHKVKRRSIVFWQFSNGGCWVFEQIVALVQAQARYEPINNAIAGLIFDSAPCVMTITSGRAAISEGTKFPIKQLLQAAFLVMTLLTFALVGNTPKRFWNRMLDEKLAVPRLYFYSTDDTLCDAKELETLLDKKQQQGLDVRVKRWDKSAHCAHLRKHPDEYIAEVQDFLTKVSKP